tara:strand:- start:1147 stop:2826 length:1680 start_codon:yes stop_codon:yes gene_type:complete
MEHFTISNNTHLFQRKNYIEPMLNDPEKYKNISNDLVLYVSSFNKKLIDFDNNTLVNAITNEIGAITINDLKTYTQEYFDQRDGVKINNEILLPSASILFHNFNIFSIFFFGKLLHPISSIPTNSTEPLEIFSLKHTNIVSYNNTSTNLNDKLLRITIQFVANQFNPTIAIYILNQKIGEYTYSLDDYLNNRIFQDEKYHLFTFTKHDDKLEFYIDSYKIIDCLTTNTCFKKGTLLYESEDTEIELNSKESTKFNASKVPFRINALGIYRNRSLNHDEINDLYVYYNNIKKSFEPYALNLIQSNDENMKKLQKYERKCQLSDKSICDNRECYDVTDWNNFQEISKNPNCLKLAINYCDSLSNIENDKICSFLKTDNIYKMASTIDSNLFYYNANNVKTNINNEQILQQLQNLGLKDIYLDKSLRTGGDQSSEMNRLINDLLNTNQTVDLSTLDALYTPTSPPPEVNEVQYSLSNSSFMDSYNKLVVENKDDNLATQTTNINENTSKKTLKNVSTDLIDLDFDDVTSQPNVYEHIIKKHKENEIKKEVSSWNIFNMFGLT